MIDPKFQPNPVVPKPKLPKATVINLNPNYQKPIEAAPNSRKIIVTTQKNNSKSFEQTIINETLKTKANEKNTAIFDLKKLLNSGLKQSKSIMQSTTDAFKNVENKIQSRFKNEIVSLEKSNQVKQKKLESKKPKKKLFEIPKLSSTKINSPTQKEIKTKKNLSSQLVILAGCFVAIFASMTIVISFREVINGFGMDLKMLQWLLVLFFLTNSVFSLYAKHQIQSKGAKRVFFNGLILIILGLLIAIFSNNVAVFILGISIIFGFGFGSLFAVAGDLFCQNSGMSKIEKSNILYNKSIAAILIITSISAAVLSFYFGWKLTLGMDLALCLLTLLNLNSISNIKEKDSEVTKANSVEILLFIIANLLIVFGIVESLYFGWFDAKNSLVVLDRIINPKISISVIALFLGFFVLAVNNFINKKTILSLKAGLENVVNFVKSGFVGGVYSLFIFGTLCFVLLATKSNLIQLAFGILPSFLGLLISSFLTKNLSTKITYKNTKLLGLVIYILGLIMAYFNISANITLISLFSPFFLIGLGIGLFQFVKSTELYEINFNVEYSKMFSIVLFGLAFFWSFSSSNFNLTTSSNLIPETLKPDLFASVNTIKNLNVCKFGNINQNNPDEVEASKIRRAVCDNFTVSIVEGSKTVITLVALISVLCFFVVMIEREEVLI
jgi:MFS family permease